MKNKFFTVLTLLGMSLASPAYVQATNKPLTPEAFSTSLADALKDQKIAPQVTQSVLSVVELQIKDFQKQIADEVAKQAKALFFDYAKNESARVDTVLKNMDDKTNKALKNSSDFVVSLEVALGKRIDTLNNEVGSLGQGLKKSSTDLTKRVDELDVKVAKLIKLGDVVNGMRADIHPYTTFKELVDEFKELQEEVAGFKNPEENSEENSEGADDNLAQRLELLGKQLDVALDGIDRQKERIDGLDSDVKGLSKSLKSVESKVIGVVKKLDQPLDQSTVDTSEQQKQTVRKDKKDKKIDPADQKRQERLEKLKATKEKQKQKQQKSSPSASVSEEEDSAVLEVKEFDRKQKEKQRVDNKKEVKKADKKGSKRQNYVEQEDLTSSQIVQSSKNKSSDPYDWENM